jgi:hypothetical protein
VGNGNGVGEHESALTTAARMLDRGAGVKACDEFVVNAAKSRGRFTETDWLSPVFLSK